MEKAIPPSGAICPPSLCICHPPLCPSLPTPLCPSLPTPLCPSLPTPLCPSLPTPLCPSLPTPLYHSLPISLWLLFCTEVAMLLKDVGLSGCVHNPLARVSGKAFTCQKEVNHCAASYDPLNMSLL